MKEENHWILICGIPGTGKTCLGNYMEKHKGFYHFDVEKEGRLPDIDSLPLNTVMTWGFVPDDPGSIEGIKLLTSKGFKMFWVDGNREAAREAFIKRNTVGLENYETQLKKINDNMGIIESFKPKKINSFNPDSKFKDYEVLVEEVIS